MLTWRHSRHSWLTPSIRSPKNSGSTWTMWPFSWRTGPRPEELAGRRGTLLGLYQGIDLTRRSSLTYGAAMPDRITVFRGPISRIARDQTELVNMVTRTVIHEVAHHFGISDARLHELGWG